MSSLTILRILVRAVLGDQIGLAAENLALRQQLAVLRREVKRPRLRPRDRVFWSERPKGRGAASGAQRSQLKALS